MVGRGLVIGGFLLGGWLFAGAGHAYAAQITPPAPHKLPASSQAADAAQATASAAPLSAVQPAASAVLGALGSSGPAAQAPTTPEPPTPEPLAQGAATSGLTGPAVSAVSGVLSSEVHQGATLASGLAGSATPGFITGTASSLPQTVMSGATADTGKPGINLNGATATARPLTSRAHPAAHAVSRPAIGPELTGHLLTQAAPSARRHAGRRHHQRATVTMVRTHRFPRRNGPGARLGAGAATQTDPISSGGGTGTAQTAAQAPLGTDSWSPSGTLIRTRISRRPAGRLEADDPAVSPD
ncbi:MAG TPA: hypothetical protein VHY58_21925 [Streptosporangiaceae bacterium]|jgi:hypothetical protein|nr:hypothetical protein [Streptosporangiaceae bacterium]